MKLLARTILGFIALIVLLGSMIGAGLFWYTLIGIVWRAM